MDEIWGTLVYNPNRIVDGKGFRLSLGLGVWEERAFVCPWAGGVGFGFGSWDGKWAIFLHVIPFCANWDVHLASGGVVLSFMHADSDRFFGEARRNEHSLATSLMCHSFVSRSVMSFI